MAARGTEELVAAPLELDAGQRAEPRRIGRDAGDRTRGLIAANVHQNALRLSVADMRSLIAANATAAAGRYRAEQSEVIAGKMAGVGGPGGKRDAAAAFCTRTTKACPKADHVTHHTFPSRKASA